MTPESAAETDWLERRRAALDEEDPMQLCFRLFFSQEEWKEEGLILTVGNGAVEGSLALQHPESDQ